VAFRDCAKISLVMALGRKAYQAARNGRLLTTLDDGPEDFGRIRDNVA